MKRYEDDRGGRFWYGRWDLVRFMFVLEVSCFATPEKPDRWELRPAWSYRRREHTSWRKP